MIKQKTFYLKTHLGIELVFDFTIIYFCYYIVKKKIDKKTNYNHSGVHNPVQIFGVLAQLT